MFFYKTKVFFSTLRSRCSRIWTFHKKKLLFLLSLIVFIIVVQAASTIHAAYQNSRQRYMTEQFLSMSNEKFLYDFNYLMSVLEENWPFFNLSISAGGICVHEVADSMRTVIINAAPETTPHDFLDLLREHFIWQIPLSQIATLWQYQFYFSSIQHNNWLTSLMGTEPSSIAMQQEIYSRPQTVIFYETLRDAGRSTLIHPTWPPPALHLPALYTEIIEEGRVAYLQVNRMMNIWHDVPLFTVDHMGKYEAVLFEFNRQIEGYDHLIIDLRGSIGNENFHFNVFVAGALLNEEISFPAYVFYKDGAYSRKVLETFDMRMFGHDVAFIQHPANFTQPLPYLDTEVNFAHVFKSMYKINPSSAAFGRFPSTDEEVRFNGEIWVLTDGQTRAGAESAVAIFKYNSIATVVGEPTTGVLRTAFDPNAALVSLPNTGIVLSFDVAYFTDMYGRPLQGYGVQPHYFNRPGLCALETVLELINEGGF